MFLLIFMTKGDNYHLKGSIAVQSSVNVLVKHGALHIIANRDD